MDRKDQFQVNVYKIQSGDYERMKCNFELIFESFIDNIPANEFADIVIHLQFIIDTLNGDESLLERITKLAKTTETKEEVENKIRIAAVIDFIKIVKDYEKHFRFILDKIEYPTMELI